MKEVLISIKPKWVETICHKIGAYADGTPVYEKSIEIRKSAPHEAPFKVYIYCTKDKLPDGRRLFINEAKVRHKYGNCSTWFNTKSKIVNPGTPYEFKVFPAGGKVVGEFICDDVFPIEVFENGAIRNYFAYGLDRSSLTIDEMGLYIGNGKIGYAWHISDLKIYDEPIDLEMFISPPKKKLCAALCANGLCADYVNVELCDNIKRCAHKRVTRPPESWCYVEPLWKTK